MAGAAIVEGNIITLRLWSTWSNQAAVNTFHYLMGVRTGLVDVNGAALFFDTLLNVLVKAIMADSSTYRGLQCYVNQLPLPQPGVSVVYAGVGTGSGLQMGAQICGLSRWQTAFAGPANRGRTYWPFPPAGLDAAGGFPSTGYLSDLEAIQDALIGVSAVTQAGGGTIDATYIIRHGLNKAGIIPPPTPITTGLASGGWATQKRRGFFGRANTSPI